VLGGDGRELLGVGRAALDRGVVEFSCFRGADQDWAAFPGEEGEVAFGFAGVRKIAEVKQVHRGSLEAEGYFRLLPSGQSGGDPERFGGSMSGARIGGNDDEEPAFHALKLRKRSVAVMISLSVASPLKVADSSSGTACFRAANPQAKSFNRPGLRDCR